MDDSQTPGDIVHASALNDGHLLFTTLNEYLYRFVSVRLSAFWTSCFFLPVVGTLCRGKTSVSAAYWLWGFFWKANTYTLPCGILMLFEAVENTEVGRMQLPEDNILYRGRNCSVLWSYETVSSAMVCAMWDKSEATVPSLNIDYYSYPSTAVAYLRMATVGEVKENDNSFF